MPRWWKILLEEQHKAHFAGLGGGRLTLELPIAEELLSRVLTDGVPPGSPVQSVRVRATADRRLVVLVQLRNASLLPPLRFEVDIESQPQLPGSPVFVLHVKAVGISALAGTAVSAFATLPSGVTWERDRIVIDVRQVAARWSWSDFFEYLTVMEAIPSRGFLTISLEAAIPVVPSPPA